MSEPLSRVRILDAALRIAGAEGTGRLTMRRLGAELGVEAMSLYHHVPGKQAVLDGLVERVVERSYPPGAPGDAAGKPSGGAAGGPPDVRTWLADFARRFRHELVSHPGVAALVGSRPVASPAGLDHVEGVASALVATGLEPRAAVRAVNAVATYVVGHALAEAEPVDAGPRDGAREAIDPARYPVLAAAVAAGLGGPADTDERFEAALDALLAGLTRATS